MRSLGSEASAKAAQKADFRQRMRTRLREMPDEELERRLDAVMGHLRAGLSSAGPKDVVGLFGGLRGEPDLVTVLGPWLRDLGAQTVVFSFGEEGMIPRRIASDADLGRAALGVWEPVVERAPPVPVAALTVILVPGMAFTRSGKRLGRGGGYYDRLMAGVSAAARCIGVSLDAFVEEDLPVEPHDLTVGELVTETGWVPCDGRCLGECMNA